MTDSTSVILPASRAFASGTLEMPESISANYAESVQTWSSFPVNMVLVIIATLLMFLTIRIFLNIAPLLFDSLSRWKACVNIDASVQLKGDRNTLATIVTLPIALVADRYGFFSADILDRIPEGWSSPVTLGIIIAAPGDFPHRAHFFLQLLGTGRPSAGADRGGHRIHRHPRRDGAYHTALRTRCHVLDCHSAQKSNFTLILRTFNYFFVSLRP